MATGSPTKLMDTSPNRRLKALFAKAKRQLEPQNEIQHSGTTSASSAPMYASTGRALEELDSQIIKEQYKVIEAQEKCIQMQRAKIEAQKVTIEGLRKQIRDRGQ